MSETSAAVATFSAVELQRRRLHRRAVEAAIWGLPLVSVEAMRQAFFRDAGANYGDIAYFSKPADWRFQTTTPNASSLYVYLNFNTKDGPVVIEIPPATGAGLFGTILDAWEVPLADVGPQGDDRGRGAKYLVLPPSFSGSIPPGCIPVKSETYNGYALFRAIPATAAQHDIDGAIALVKQMRVYPYARIGRPPAGRFIDITGTLFDGIVPFDQTFYDMLARMVNEEPVLTRDLVAMSQLSALGIEKGREFKPDSELRGILRDAIAEAHAGFMAATMEVTPFWPGSHWGFHFVNAARTGFSFQMPGRYFVDERALVYFIAYASTKNLGAATFYLAEVCDASGEPLDGSRTYRLHVPNNVPVRQYWAATVYDLETAGFIRDAPNLTIDSYNQKVEKNPDGSVDVYFAPAPPSGHEANWIYTAPGHPWFTLFRFYGPEKPLLDKTWVLPDIERLH